MVSWKGRSSIFVEQGRYMCIDLKSFYASVECVERGLDPMSALLAVADPERGEKTICLAVTPAMKKMGVRSRCRLYDIPDGIEYIKARPRMSLYIQYSADIYGIYLKYFSKDDIHIYSIDEVFIDIGKYRKTYGDDPKALALKVMKDIRKDTGIPSSCGIGTNLYLAKIALDIMAKHSEDGIGMLDESTYREKLWDHKPVTDFWRVGRGSASRLEKYGIYTMRQLASADEKLIYRIFGIDGELLIDHAWGRETATIEDIKRYRPKSRCLSSGQVLPSAYDWEKTEQIVKEMTEQLCLELVEKRLVTDSVSLHISYSGMTGGHAGGSVSLPFCTCSVRIIKAHMDELYRKIACRHCGARKINITFSGVVPDTYEGFDLINTAGDVERDKREAQTILAIKHRYGKNAILRAYNLEKYSTAAERNRQIGGHRA